MTLSQVAVLTKQILTITIIAIVLSIASFIGYKVWYAYYLAHLPKVEEKPDTKFGVLPAPDFPPVNVSSSNFSYSVDTVTGGLPQLGVDKGFAKLIKVYYVVKTVASLLSSEKSQSLAEKFNLNVDPQIITETNYIFNDKAKSLNIDLDSANFIYQNTATISATATLEDDSKLVSDFKNILTSMGIFKADLATGPNKIIYLRNDNGNFVPTDVRTEASGAQISLWPGAIDSKPIVTDLFNTALVNATVFKSASDIENYLNLNYTYYQIDTSTFATYPLQTPDQALADLKAGNGVIMLNPQKPKISVTSVYLAYYLPSLYHPYLIPIYVFEGPGFAAYTAAIAQDSPTPTK